MKLKHAKKRSWRLYLALKHVLQLRRMPTEALRVLVGHIVHYFSIMRPGLSCLHHVYKFLYQGLDGRGHTIPNCVKRELRVVVGLIFLVEVDLGSPYSDIVYCGDSSSYGFCFQTTRASVAEQRNLFKFHERWRFVEVEHDLGRTLGQHQSWSADFEVPNLAYTRWLCERLGIPEPNSGELEAGTRGPHSRDQRRKFEVIEVVGMVPRLPDELLEPERWRTVVQRRWKHKEAIHMKEGRVALMALRRESRNTSCHGRRLLTLCDNLSCVCKGRAKDYSLLALCRRAAAIQIACGIRWHLRYVETKRNPSDHDSRVFGKEKEKQRRSDTQTKPSGCQSCPSTQSREPAASPLPCSSTSVQRRQPTASYGRGELSGRAHGERQTSRIGGRENSLHARHDLAMLGSVQSCTSAGGGSLQHGQLRPSCSRSTMRPFEVSAKMWSSGGVDRAPAAGEREPKRGKSALELFSGTAHLTSSMLSHGLRTAAPFDTRFGSGFDLTKKHVQELILGWLYTGLIWYIHLGTPCTIFSIAKKKSATGVKLVMSMKCVEFTIKVIKTCLSLGIFFSLENPKTSKLFKIPKLCRVLQHHTVSFIEFDCCRYGCPFRKPTIIVSSLNILRQLGRRCQCQHNHEQLRGRVKIPLPNGKSEWYWKTTLAGEYSGELCHLWSSLLRQVAPAESIRCFHEPDFLPLWLDEIRQVTSGGVPERIEISKCPTRYVCPWEKAIDSWGTEAEAKREGQERKVKESSRD